ncbi:MAG: SUMF1/EgtB/PvdO family nonheme iron enzyme [Treponema sp.]|nr:SUMF1/EgtB/PvdO family nonheme iron enzyme [Treponema sp.]
MKLRKLLVAAVLLATGTVAFAESAEYKALLKEAKAYEQKKQWVYALGAYWDAMAADTAENVTEAADAFAKLEDTITNGNPGYGEFDEFDIYDSWLLLCQDFEKYWVENCPRALSFGKLQRGNIDRATRTASYTIEITWDWTAKFKRIGKAVITGLNASRKDNWTQGIPKRWPLYSVYESKVKEGSYIVNDIPFFYAKATDEDLRPAVVYGKVVEEYFIVPAALACDRWMPVSYDGSGWESFVKKTETSFTLYTIVFSVVGVNGKALLKGPAVHIQGGNTRCIYEFTGVSQDAMKQIDGGSVSIRLESISLKYGYEGKLAGQDGLRTENLAKMPEIALKNVTALSAYDESKKDEDIAEDAIKAATAVTVQKRLEEFLKNDGLVTVESGSFMMGKEEKAEPVHKVNLSEYLVAPTEVPQWLYLAVMGENPSKQVGQDLPVEYISWYDAVIFCNKLSVLAELKPCYSKGGTTDTAQWGAVPSKWADAEKYVISCDFSATGYRLPTEAEWEYAARGGKNQSATAYAGSDVIDEVAWYIKNSNHRKKGKNGVVDVAKSSGYGYEIHAAGAKKSNALGLYDMSGNVAEWCWDGYDDRNREYPAREQTNPQGINALYKVVRGGSSAFPDDFVTVYKRGYKTAYSTSDSYDTGYASWDSCIGFRLARTSEKSSSEQAVAAKKAKRAETVNKLKNLFTK